MKFSIFIVLLISFASQAVELKARVTDLEQPTDIKFFPNSSEKLLVAGKEGQLTFTDLSKNNTYLVYDFDVKSGSEMGLLGLTSLKSKPLDINSSPE